MLKAFFTYTFLQNAVVAAILSSIACGIIGAIIVEKKLVVMSGGIAHTSFGGIGLGYFIGIEPIWGGLFFALIAAIGSAVIKKRTNVNTDTIISMFWSVGMALGIIFIALTPGYPPDMTSYLFGNILMVSRASIYMMLLLDTIVVAITTSQFNYWKAYLFDDEFAFVLGIPVRLLEYLLFVLIALAIVILIRVVGIILSIALLTIPPTIAKLFFNDLKKIMLGAVLVGTGLSIVGLLLSYRFNIASGAAIVLVSGLTYILTLVAAKSLFLKKVKDTGIRSNISH